MLDLRSWELARYNVDDTPTQAALDAIAERVRKAIADASAACPEPVALPGVDGMLAEIAGLKARAIVPITFEVKRLNRKDAQAHQRILSSAMRAEVERLRAANIDPREKVEGDTPTTAMLRGMHATAEMGLAGLDFFEAVGADYIRKCFADWTKNWTGVTLDGKPIRDGAEIVDFADNDLVKTVLIELRRASQLSVMEGNASASPSGSAQAAGIATADSTSTAPSTESADGTAA